MFNLILKNLGARKMRLLITSFAVLLGVAFMAGPLSFHGFHAFHRFHFDSFQDRVWVK